MKNFFDYKYRLYFRTPFTSFSQSKDIVYTDDYEKIKNKIENIGTDKGYTEYMILIKTEQGVDVIREPLERPKKLVKTLGYF